MTDKLTFDFTNVPSYEWAESYYLTYELDINLSSIKESVLYHTQLVKDKREQLKNAIDSDTYLQSDEKDEFKAQYYHQRFEHAERAIDDLEEILYNSSVLTVFSVFEGKMKYLCELIESETKSKLKHTDLKSSNGDFGQFIKYLTSVFGVETIKSNSYTDAISKYKTVRNKIAHQNSKISSSELTRIKTLNNLKTDSFGDFHKLTITSHLFITELIDTIDKYFQELVKEVDKRMNEFKKGH